MAKYRVTGPDGGTYDITAPEGASESEIMDYVRQNAGQSSGSPEGAAPVEQAETPSLAGRIGRGVLRGVRDPIDAGAQMLVRGVEKAIPDSWTGLDQWAKGEVAKVDGINTDAESQYQESRGSSAGTFDPSRLGGNIVGTAPLAMLAPAGGTLAARTALGAATGAGFGALSPVESPGDDFWSQKARQAGVGAATGAAAAPVAGALARIIRPKTSPEVRSLMREGVTPTPGQVLGGAFRSTEDKLTSIPLIGDAIRMGQRRGIEQFNRAAVNRTLFPIGKGLPKGVSGREAIQYADDAIGQYYDDVLAKVGPANLDGQLSADLTRTLGGLSGTPDKAKSFVTEIQKQIAERARNGTLNGRAFKDIESRLGERAAHYRASLDPADKDLGAAFFEAQRAMREWLQRSAPPGVAADVGKANQAWASFVRVRNAAGMQGAEGGVFTPAQLSAGVRRADRSAGKGAFAKGESLMQDLSDAGRAALSQRVPDSGTPGRVMAAAMAGGGLGFLSPGALAGAGLSALPYTGLGQRAAAGLLASRPAFADPLAEGVRSMGTPVITAGLLGLLKQ